MIRRRFFLIAFSASLCLGSAGAGIAQSNLASRERRPLSVAVPLSEMPQIDRDLAEQIEIWKPLEELHSQSTQAERRAVLRRLIAATIMECHFDAQSIEAEAQRERAELEYVRDCLVSKRDKKLEVNNAANFISSGTLNIIGSALGFSESMPPLSGNLNQMLSGAVSTGMSSYALKQSASARAKGMSKPTLLAELFGRPCDARTTYPESVWRYMNSKSPEYPELTRAQMLEKRWIDRNHLEVHGSKKEKHKIDIVTGVETRSLSIDDLNDQIVMLADIGNMAALMSSKLRDFLLLLDSRRAAAEQML